MSKFERLNVDIRKENGTSAARRTRLQNKVPGVVYHSGAVSYTHLRAHET